MNEQNAAALTVLAFPFVALAAWFWDQHRHRDIKNYAPNINLGHAALVLVATYIAIRVLMFLFH